MLINIFLYKYYFNIWKRIILLKDEYKIIMKMYQQYNSKNIYQNITIHYIALYLSKIGTSYILSLMFAYFKLRLYHFKNKFKKYLLI